MVVPKTILVTGGAGFIGSHLVDKLMELGAKVIVLDDLSTGKLTHLPRGVNFHHGSITESTVEEIFHKEKPNVVFHMAAQISTSSSVRDPVQDAQTNILGTLRLLDAARHHGIEKFIYSSTGGALYGDPEENPCTEDQPIRPLSPYGISKLVGEQYLDLYHRIYRLNYTSLRYGNVYGPRQDPKGEAGVIAIFCMNMLKNSPPRIFGTGDQERDFIYVNDVVEANILAMEQRTVGPYNIGTGISCSVNDIFSMLSANLKFRKAPIYSPNRMGDVHQISLDATKALTEMGWRAKVDIQDGLSYTAEYFRNMVRTPV